MQGIKNYINGQLIAPLQGNYIDNYEPATGQVYGQIPNSDSADIELAYSAAKKAFPTWSKTTLTERSAILGKIAYTITIYIII